MEVKPICKYTTKIHDKYSTTQSLGVNMLFFITHKFLINKYYFNKYFCI